MGKIHSETLKALMLCSNNRGITLLSRLGKVYAKVLDKRLRQTVKPQIQEEQRRFCPGGRTADQLFTLSQIFEGPSEFAYSVSMCFFGFGEGV